MIKISCPKCHGKKLYKMSTGRRRCARCKYAPGETGSHWCYNKNVEPKGHRHWLMMQISSIINLPHILFFEGIS